MTPKPEECEVCREADLSCGGVMGCARKLNLDEPDKSRATAECYRLGYERRGVEITVLRAQLEDAAALRVRLAEERDYFKGAYSRKLDDEKRALEAASAAVAEAERLEHLAVHWEQRAIAKGAQLADCAKERDEARDALRAMTDLAQYHVFEIESIATNDPTPENRKRSRQAWKDYRNAESLLAKASGACHAGKPDGAAEAGMALDSREREVMEAWRSYFGQLTEILFPGVRVVGWKDVLARAATLAGPIEGPTHKEGT